MKIRNRFDTEPVVPAFEDLKRRIEAVSTDEMLAQTLWYLATKCRSAPCDFLEPLLEHPDPDMLVDLIFALERFTDPKATRFIQRLARSDNDDVRKFARDAL